MTSECDRIFESGKYGHLIGCRPKGSVFLLPATRVDAREAHTLIALAAMVLLFISSTPHPLPKPPFPSLTSS